MWCLPAWSAGARYYTLHWVAGRRHTARSVPASQAEDAHPSGQWLPSKSNGRRICRPVRLCYFDYFWSFHCTNKVKKNDYSVRKWQLSLRRHYKSCDKCHGNERLKRKALRRLRKTDIEGANDQKSCRTKNHGVGPVLRDRFVENPVPKWYVPNWSCTELAHNPKYLSTLWFAVLARVYCVEGKPYMYS